jgi:hypothetical protein
MFIYFRDHVRINETGLNVKDCCIGNHRFNSWNALKCVQFTSIALPIVTPLARVVISALPLSNERVSSGEFILFFCIFVVVPNSIYR